MCTLCRSLLIAAEFVAPQVASCHTLLQLHLHLGMRLGFAQSCDVLQLVLMHILADMI